MKTKIVKKWNTIEENVNGNYQDYGIYKVETVKRKSPLTDFEGIYRVLKMKSWANIIAITPNKEVVMVVQYRHGIDNITTEIPAGIVEIDEKPEDAVMRELKEETGYIGDKPLLLGEFFPNPALQDNSCSSWLITNAQFSCEPLPDKDEDIEIKLVPLTEINEMINKGEIAHGLTLSAFYLLLQKIGLGDINEDHIDELIN